MPRALSPDLLELLRCPETRQRLRVADASELASLNARVATGTLVSRAGQARTTPLAAALLRDDGTLAYPIEDDIPVLLIDEAFPL
jgi:uncharacterized protein YbaR (Trm112 family)